MITNDTQEKEQRQFRRFTILGKIGWFVSFRFLRPSWWWGRRNSLFDDEQPLVSLAKLAEEGIEKPTTARRMSKADITRSMELFGAIMKSDGGLNEDEIAVIREFWNSCAPEDMAGEFKQMVSEIKRGDDVYLHIRNTMFLLKKNAHGSSTKELARTLINMAFLDGVNSKQAREASDMAVRLGLTTSEIRLISAEVRRKLQEENDGNITK